MLVFTDGNATDLSDESIDWKKLPPIYPVVLGDDRPAKDIRVTQVSASQTNFEAAPVTVLAEVTSHGFADETIVVQLLDESGEELQRQLIKDLDNDKPLALRFLVKPMHRGVHFYVVHAFAESEEPHLTTPETSAEATLVNNSRLVMVDRGGGPYRVLYVTGRPNWEFKFLRRAIEEDEEVNLVGLVRIAKREPKFNYRGRTGETTNPLFRGFGDQDPEQLEQYDDAVLLRLGTTDKEELRDGFPKNADDLYKYHAIVIDDLEAEFFHQDQMSLLQDFVSERGGGLLMLGGKESFIKGKYDRTPIGELLPVYLNRLPNDQTGSDYKLSLTREGWLEPWTRIRSTEDAERTRLKSMPEFHTLNRVPGIKPGATVLAKVTSDDGNEHPALVVQRFGKGRSSAFLIGDLWRWQLRKKSTDAGDLEKSWRQTVRWLVADVPQRIEVDVRRKQEDPNFPVEISVKVHDQLFDPLDNATVEMHVTDPNGGEVGADRRT